MPQRQLPTGDEPFPVPPQTWHFRQSIEYSMTANRAVLDLASKYREDFLFNIYQMGRNSIQRGSQDSWTITPKRIEALKEAAAKQTKRRQGRAEADRAGGETAAPATESPTVAMERAAGAVPANSMRPSCTIPRCAIRAATSCRPISPTFPPPPNSSTR